MGLQLIFLTLQLGQVQRIQIASVFVVTRRVNIFANADAAVVVVRGQVSDARGSPLVVGRLVVRGPDLFNHLLVISLYKLRIVIDTAMRKNTRTSQSRIVCSLAF